MLTFTFNIYFNYLTSGHLYFTLCVIFILALCSDSLHLPTLYSEYENSPSSYSLLRNIFLPYIWEFLAPYFYDVHSLLYLHKQNLQDDVGLTASFLIFV
jgi:hypothetical protein